MAPGDNLSSREIDSMINRLDERVELLKRNFERYFLGIDKRPPLAMRRQVVREVFELEQTFINNTAQKFKLRSLVQRFSTYKTYWNRTMRQIEEGTYHRDRNRAERRQKRHERREERLEEQNQAFELDPDQDFIEDLADIDLEAVFDDVAAPQASPQRPSASDSGDGMSDAERERIKQERLAEIQRKLGLGGGAPQPVQPAQPAAQPAQPTSAREDKLAAMRRKLGRTSSGPVRTTSAVGNSASPRSEKLERLQRKVSREQSGPQRTIARTGQQPAATDQRQRTSSAAQRVVQRPGSGDDESARRVYNNLMEAKRRCKEPTDNLSFDAVKRSMDQQRESIRQKRGARDVDFQVVIKDGRAFIKPETKD